MFGSFGGAVTHTSVTFVSQAATDAGVGGQIGLQKQTVPVSHCRNIGKADMIHNDWQPDISVDPETYEVTADGEVLTCEPAERLPLAQLYNLF